MRKKKKGGGLDYLNERLSQVLHTVSLYFTTLTLLTLLKGGGLSERTPSRDQYLFTLLLLLYLLYLLYLKVVDYLKERLRETKTVKFFDNRYSVYLLYWYKSTNTDTALSIYLLYWYKSTNADAPLLLHLPPARFSRSCCSQFACFTGTKVQILTQLEETARVSRSS
jgi:hypothetical protein